MFRLRCMAPGIIAFILLAAAPERLRAQELYVSAETGGITKVDASNCTVSQFTPFDKNLLSQGLKFGPDGNLYVCSNTDNTVRRFDGVTGAFMGVFASGAPLNAPIGLTFGPDGNLYITGAGGSTVLPYSGTTGAFMDVFLNC